MGKYLKVVLSIALAFVAVVTMHEVIIPTAEAAAASIPFLQDPETLGVIVAMPTTSLMALKNIPEQQPNPPGARRLYAILTSDLLDTVVDWPAIADITAAECTVAVPVKVGKTLALITPADNSLEGTFESMGDRYYQAFKHGVAFDIAGTQKEQLSAAALFVNAGAIFIMEEHDGSKKIYGTKLNPIVLKQKGTTGKKGGDKKGMTLSGDNDSFMFAPPIYKDTLTLPLPA